MPIIPAPKEQSVQPEGQFNYQTPNATPTAMGSGVGQATEQAGDVASDIALRQQSIKNESDNVGALNALMSKTQDLQNGNKDAGITGYRTLVGQNAVDALPDYTQKIQDAYKEVRSGLNPAAARMFDQTAFRVVRGATDSMGSYSAQQQDVTDHQNLRAQVSLAQEGALTYADDPAGWNAHLGAVQAASLTASQRLGLGSDATEMQRMRDVSQVYEDRTQQLMLRNPMEAASFYHQNIGAIAPDKRYEIERQLKTTTDTQYAHTDGTAAYQSVVGQDGNNSPLAENKGAPDLPAFQQKDIDRVANFVKAPSQYDAAIKDAADRYNVSPTEIKMKIGIESGGIAKAVNPASGTTGLGQFTEATAKQYGITDRNDPVQSINGIAKMLAANGGTVGGNAAGADRAYYGGSPTAKGPNTDQYVENTRAVRQALIGPSAPAPMTAAQLEGQEGAVLTAARAQAAQRRPNDQVYADQVANEAHAKWATDVQSLKSQDYANYSQVLDATIQGKAQTMSDLPPAVQQVLSKLSPQNTLSIQSQFERNTREANGEFAHSDPKVVNDLLQRINAPEGDPNKITQPGQLTEYMGKGLNYTDQQRLNKEIQQANSPEGSQFQKQLAQAKETGRKMLNSSLTGAALQHPEIAEEAAYRFGVDLDQKIAAARTAKADPQALLTPGNPAYVLDPNRVSAFMPSEAQIAQHRLQATQPSAANATPGAPAKPVVPRIPGETPAAYLARVASK
jgi:hypothetical protein